MHEYGINRKPIDSRLQKYWSETSPNSILFYTGHEMQ
jgi:hypothetical protein